MRFFIAAYIEFFTMLANCVRMLKNSFDYDPVICRVNITLFRSKKLNLNCKIDFYSILNEIEIFFFKGDICLN